MWLTSRFWLSPPSRATCSNKFTNRKCHNIHQSNSSVALKHSQSGEEFCWFEETKKRRKSFTQGVKFQKQLRSQCFWLRSHLGHPRDLIKWHVFNSFLRFVEGLNHQSLQLLSGQLLFIEVFVQCAYIQVRALLRGELVLVYAMTIVTLLFARFLVVSVKNDMLQQRYRLTIHTIIKQNKNVFFELMPASHLYLDLL